jgi:hypothetical protein
MRIRVCVLVVVMATLAWVVFVRYVQTGNKTTPQIQVVPTAPVGMLEQVGRVLNAPMASDLLADVPFAPTVCLALLELEARAVHVRR